MLQWDEIEPRKVTSLAVALHCKSIMCMCIVYHYMSDNHHNNSVITVLLKSLENVANFLWCIKLKPSKLVATVLRKSFHKVHEPLLQTVHEYCYV